MNDEFKYLAYLSSYPDGINEGTIKLFSKRTDADEYLTSLKAEYGNNLVCYEILLLKVN
jgi:hypothetical protein